MRLIPHILCSLCLLLSTLEVQGQNVSIQAKIDRGEIRTGEQAAIDVVIRTRNLAQTKFYLTEDLRQGEPFVVLEFTPLDTIDIDGKLQEITARMIVTSFDSTLITIPPIIVETPDGQAQTAPLALNVIQPEVDAAHPENFKDIKDPWEVSLRLSDIWEMLYRSPIFWAVVALLVVGGLLYRWRDKLKRAPQPKLVPPPPYCHATRALFDDPRRTDDGAPSDSRGFQGFLLHYHRGAQAIYGRGAPVDDRRDDLRRSHRPPRCSGG